MGLRCLIGHDYGEPRTTREREERGDEVVVTVLEYRECARCGERRVISENKEVRAGDGPGDDAPDPAPGDPPGDDRSDAGRPETPGEFDDVSAEEDDGVILDDEPPEEGRQYGQWPESDDARSDDADAGAGTGDRPEVEASGDWPRTPESDEGFSADPAGDGPAEDVEFGGGLSPERDGGSGAPADADTRSPAEEEDVEFIDEADPDDAASSSAAEADTEDVGTSGASGAPEPAGTDAAEPDTPDRSEADASADVASGDGAPDTGIRSAGPGPSPTGQQRLAGVETEFVCPECDHTAPATSSSLRPGDICPECGRGYLSERERE